VRDKTNRSFKNLSPASKLATEGARNNIKDWAARRQFPLTVATKVMDDLGKEATIAQTKAEIKKRVSSAT
jgi:hypothetical protein